MESGSSSLIHAILYENKASWPDRSKVEISIRWINLVKYCKNNNN